jgi:hypothetical protein
MGYGKEANMAKRQFCFLCVREGRERVSCIPAFTFTDNSMRSFMRRWHACEDHADMARTELAKRES